MRRLLPLLLLPGLALGQDDDGHLQRNTALIRQYPHLDMLLTKAESLAKDGRFRDALDIYIEAIRDYPNHLVPVPVDSVIPKSPARYLGVLEHCLREVEKWPEPGRAAYRAHYDGFARQEFDAARNTQDLDALALVAERYPFSSFADDALALLGNLAIEAGEPARAAAAFERLLAIPDTDLPRPLTFARLAAAYAQTGRVDALTALAARAGREAPRGTVLLGDRQATLAEFINGLLKRTSPALAAVDTGAWECLQGNGTGTRTAEPTPLVNRAWTAPVPLIEFDGDDEEFGYGQLRSRVGTSYRPLFPAVSDGICYVHNEYQVWAYNLFAARPEALWTHRTQPPAGGTLLHEERLAHTMSVHEGRVFATLVTAVGRMETRMNYIHVKFPFPKRALVALDAYSGRPLWRIGGSWEAKDVLDGLSIPTAPTPDGGRLYVGAVKQATNTDPFEHYVLCLDAATGRVLWQTFVASGGTEINLFGNSTRESVGGACGVSGDSVYYGTNHGAFASLDRRTGRLKWVYKYHQLPVNPTRSVQIRRNPLEWCNGAPVVAHDQVFFAATDSRTLYSLDARTGRKRWERGRGDLRHIYGAWGHVLVAGGDALEWYDVSRDGKLVGRFEPEHGHGTGRGAIAVDGVYFPTTEGMYRVPLNGQKPDYTRWPGGRGESGNIVVAEGALVVAGQSWVDAFFDRRDREAEIAAVLAKNPDNAPLLYRSALRLLQSGREEQAAELLAKVIELAGRSHRAADERVERAARRRLHGVLLEAAARAIAEKNAAKARAHLARAAEFAPDLASAIEASTRLGALEEPDAAVARLQDLLERHGEEQVGGRRAAEVLRDEIARHLAAGRGPYRRYDGKAAALLERAKGAGTAEAHLDVWRRYPNSEAAEAALLGAAEAYERIGRPEDASATLWLFLREYPKSARAAEAQVALVKSLEKRKRWSAAAVILRRMLRGTPDAETRAFAEGRLAREEYRTSGGAGAAVSLKPPLKPAGAYVERDAGGLYVLRVEGGAPARAAGLLFVVAGPALKAVRAETGAVEWKHALEGTPRAAYAHDESLIVCTEKAIVRLNPATGGVEWRHAPPAAMRDFAVAGTAVCAISSRPGSDATSVLTALDAGSGASLWSQGFEGMAVGGGLAPAGDRVALATVAPNRLLVFSADTGRREIDQALYSGGGGLRVLGVQDGLLLLHVERVALESYELSNGRLKWRYSMKGFEQADVRVGRGCVFVLGRQERKFVGSVISMANGKLTAIKEGLGLDDVQQVLLDDSRAYVVSPAPGGSAARVRAFALADLSPVWVTDAPVPFMRLAARLASKHVVVFGLGRLESGKFDFAASVLDNGGVVVQNMKGDGSYERQAGFDLAGDGIVIVVDNRVEVHK